MAVRGLETAISASTGRNRGDLKKNNRPHPPHPPPQLGAFHTRVGEPGGGGRGQGDGQTDGQADGGSRRRFPLEKYPTAARSGGTQRSDSGGRAPQTGFYGRKRSFFPKKPFIVPKTYKKKPFPPKIYQKHHFLPPKFTKSPLFSPVFQTPLFSPQPDLFFPKPLLFSKNPFFSPKKAFSLPKKVFYFQTRSTFPKKPTF